MGCIMTPMPNHLSTHLSLPLNHKPLIKEWRKERSDVEQMRRMVRSVEMAWLSGLVC